MEVTESMKNIALATDDNYALPCAVCVTSILENNVNCHIYILTFHLSERYRDIFKHLSQCYCQQLDIITVTNDKIPKMQESIRYPMSIYLRLLLPSLLKVNKVLYLDCDIIVKKDLTPLFEIDLCDSPCAAVEDNINDDIINRNRLKLETNCYNSGVLLLNLDFWRENDVSHKIFEFLVDNYGNLLYPDQDALNILYSEKIVHCPFTYNMQHSFFFKKNKLFLHWSKWNEIDACIEDPAIIHYTDSFKPWYKECSHPYKKCFWYYAKKHPFIDIEEKPYYPLFYRMIMAITGLIQKQAYKWCRKDIVKK